MAGNSRNFLSGLGALFLGVSVSLAQTPASGGGPVYSQFGGYPAPDWNAAKHNSFAQDSLDDRNGSLLVGDPLLDRPNLGWFGTAEVDLMASHVHSELTDTVAVGAKLSTVSLPMANLNWTAAPRFELGYRFGQAAGELLVTYRFVSTSGSATTANFDPAGNAGALRSRFDMNVIDLDYANQENSLLPWLGMKWRVGVRGASLYFDSQEVSPLLAQHVTNFFSGAGPHATLDLHCPLVQNRLSLFGRVDGAAVFGNVRQGFAETDVTGAGSVSGFTAPRLFMSTTMLNVQTGLAYTPSESWRLSAGYTYEHWWDATFTVPSRGDVWTQGIFFRSEWRY